MVGVMDFLGDMIFEGALRKMTKAGALKVLESNGQQILVAVDYNDVKERPPGQGNIVKGKLRMAGPIARALAMEAVKYENDRRRKGGIAGDAEKPDADLSGDGRPAESPAQAENQPGDSQGLFQDGEAGGSATGGKAPGAGAKPGA
jgi:hypothetical protein